MSRKGTLKGCLITFIIFMIGLYFMRYSAQKLEIISGGYGIFDLTIGWSKAEMLQHLTSLGEEGRKYYKESFYIVDFIYPFLYASFYLTALSYLVGKVKLKNSAYFLPYLPVIALLSDWCENIVVLSMLNNPTKIHQLQVNLFNFCNISKFIFVYSALISILLLLLYLSVKKVKFFADL